MGDWLRTESERINREGEGIQVDSLEDFIAKILALEEEERKNGSAAEDP